MTIQQIIYLRETEDKVEFKEAKTQYTYNKERRSILGYVVALANECGGRLILGIKENKTLPHTVVGSTAWEGNEKALEEDIYRDLKIRVTTEVLYEQDKRVLVIHIPSRPLGRTLKFNDVHLMRVGEQLLPMSDECLLKILQEQEPDFSAKICEGLSLTDLDEVAISLMKKGYAQKQNNPQFEQLSVEQTLSDLRLIDAEGHFTYSDAYQVSLVLNAEVIDKSFHVYINTYQKSNKEPKLGVEQIITLYKIRNGLFQNLKLDVLAQLEKAGLIRKTSNASSRYLLNDNFYLLEQENKQIGSRYIKTEISDILLNLQDNELKVGDLEEILKDRINRNQIKYLLVKLKEDGIINTIGKTSGTKYILADTFKNLRGEILIEKVTARLYELNHEPIFQFSKK